MTEEMITRGELKGLEMSVPWMVTSGVRIESGHPARQIVQDGIQLYVVGADRTALRLDLDVHDAGDLHQALEAHMENVAAHDVKPITLEERRRALRGGKWEEFRGRNLKAIQDEIDNPLEVKGEAGVMRPIWGQVKPVPPSQELLDAVRDLVVAWTNNGPAASVNHQVRLNAVAQAFPGLAGLLNRVAQETP